MDLANSVAPVRAVIRCKVKMQLTQIAYTQQDTPEPLDEALIKDLAATCFRSDAYQSALKTCRTKRDAARVEDLFAADIAQTYRHMTQQHHNSLVQQLNGLL
jgi:hypothetical protein